MADSLVLYRGSFDFQERNDPCFSTSGFEPDTARWPWQGASYLKRAFQDGLKKFQPLEGFPRMFLQDSTDDGGNVITIIDLNYIGFRGPLPPPKAESSLVTQSFTYTVIGNPSESWSGQYFAPRTKWTWYTNTAPNPTSPMYQTTEGGIAPASTLYGLRDGNGAVYPFSAASAVAARLPVKNRISDYQRDNIVPGGLWRCTCTVDLNFEQATA